MQGGEYSVSSSCVMLEYTATTTTCACSFPIASARRLQTEGSQSVSSGVITVAGDVGGQIFRPLQDDDDDAASDDDTLATGAIVGIAIACAVVAGLAIFALYYTSTSSKAVAPGTYEDEERPAFNTTPAAQQGGAGAGAGKEGAEGYGGGGMPAPAPVSAE
ncbi:hypothetical protein B484DRAFT_460119 [Ochromonadaceae sp. CCMP2298]|nr:hypothetical protein B484DRAFT_460119 [Ochromonadaceae sp. CCMP2298]